MIKINSLYLIQLVLLPSLLFCNEPQIDKQSFKSSAYVDMGQIISGSSEQHNLDDISNAFLPRSGIKFVTHTVFSKNLHVKIGVGGLFWYPFPSDPKADHTRIIKFGPGIAESSGEYFFDILGEKNSSIKFGFFSYKYNKDAANLGEYLLRSEAYPNFVKTGGWSLINSAGYKSLGAKFSWKSSSEKLIHDFLLFSEFQESPIFDFSPTYILSIKPNNIIEFGGGISLHRWLSVRPSHESPKDPKNTYLEIPNFPYLPEIIDTTYYNVFGDKNDPNNIKAIITKQKEFQGGTMAEMESHIQNWIDTNGNIPYDEFLYQLTDPVLRAANPSQITMDDPLYIASPASYEATQTKRYNPLVKENLTFQAVKIMGRFCLDLKTVFGLQENINPSDLKLYGEFSVLGLKNQPYYYENLINRIPIMFGFNFPTFNLLDHLSVQVEYYKNPYPNSRREPFLNTFPIQAIPEDDPALYNPSDYSKDDIKWSVNLKKNLVPGLVVYCQAASDHMRLRDFSARPMYAPITNKPSEWYYIFRLEYGGW